MLLHNIFPIKAYFCILSPFLEHILLVDILGENFCILYFSDIFYATIFPRKHQNNLFLFLQCF